MIETIKKRPLRRHGIQTVQKTILKNDVRAMLNGSGHAYSKKRPDHDGRLEDADTISQAFSVLGRSVSSGCGTESFRFKSETGW